MTSAESWAFIAKMEIEAAEADRKFNAIIGWIEDMAKKRLQKGPKIIRRDCPACKGAGFFKNVRCTNCSGKGVVFTLGDPDQKRLPGQ